MASIVRAFIGLLYKEQGLVAARTFVHTHLLSRQFPIQSLLHFRDPKFVLSNTLKKYQREPPISRLLKETGRMSISPVFVVGIFSGEVKVGEAFGSSLRMAEFRVRISPIRLLLPSF